MKATIRIPTVQFGYIELVDEFEGDLEIGLLIETHNKVIAAYEATKADVQKLKDDNF